MLFLDNLIQKISRIKTILEKICIGIQYPSFRLILIYVPIILSYINS